MLEQHGFARNKIWTVDDNPPPLPSTDSQGKSFIDLLLKPSEEDIKGWPHRYKLNRNYLQTPHSVPTMPCDVFFHFFLLLY